MLWSRPSLRQIVFFEADRIFGKTSISDAASFLSSKQTQEHTNGSLFQLFPQLSEFVEVNNSFVTTAFWHTLRETSRFSSSLSRFKQERFSTSIITANSVRTTSAQFVYHWLNVPGVITWCLWFVLVSNSNCITDRETTVALLFCLFSKSSSKPLEKGDTRTITLVVGFTAATHLVSREDLLEENRVLKLLNQQCWSIVTLVICVSLRDGMFLSQGFLLRSDSWKLRAICDKRLSSLWVSSHLYSHAFLHVRESVSRILIPQFPSSYPSFNYVSSCLCIVHVILIVIITTTWTSWMITGINNCWLHLLFQPNRHFLTLRWISFLLYIFLHQWHEHPHD